MPLPVVVLFHHSLFASGIASRLRERTDLFDVQTLDASLTDVTLQLRIARPAIVIIDAVDTSVSEIIPILKLFEILPDAKVLQLDYNRDRVQIFSSEQRRTHETGELISVMQDISVVPQQPAHA
jgi:DNA-binding NarL/FixJ family response regulator